MAEASPDFAQWTVIASSTVGAAIVNLGGALKITEATGYGVTLVNVSVEANPPSSTAKRQYLRLRVARP